MRLRLNSAIDLHVCLTGKVLEAALLAQSSSDHGRLERFRLEIIKQVRRWVDHNRLSVLERHPELAELCACDLLYQAEGEGAVTLDSDLHDSLHAWGYAERMLASFVLQTAITPIPGVRLAMMHKAVTEEAWPALG